MTLTPKALMLLDYLAVHAGELLTPERLLEAVWGWDNPVGTRAVDHRIAELRRVLDEDSGNPTWMVLAERATEQRAERQLDAAVAAARDERTRLIRRLDHEIKNPLTTIRAGLANVDAAQLSEPARQALSTVDEQARRLGRLIGDLRKLGEVESEDIEQTTVDLAVVVTDVAAAFDDLEGSAQRSLQLVVPEVPWRVGAIEGDPDLVFLAVMNLVSNALKFSAPGGRTELRALEEDRHAVVEVADTGFGIPAGELPFVWDDTAAIILRNAIPTVDSTDEPLGEWRYR